jgi:regulatory protein
MAFSKVRKSAWDRLLGYLGRRDHSETELIKKLLKYHDVSEIEAVILRARQHDMIAQPEVLSKETAAQLLRKGKGSLYISAYLKKKGLPAAKLNEEEQILQALEMTVRRLRLEAPISREQRIKVQRFLMNRGFTGGVVAKVITQLSKG